MRELIHALARLIPPTPKRGHSVLFSKVYLYKRVFFNLGHEGRDRKFPKWKLSILETYWKLSETFQAQFWRLGNFLWTEKVSRFYTGILCYCSSSGISIYCFTRARDS